MATKRPAGEDSPVPPSKKPLLTQAPLHVIPATCQEDLDIKILQVKMINKGGVVNKMWENHNCNSVKLLY